MRIELNEEIASTLTGVTGTSKIHETLLPQNFSFSNDAVTYDLFLTSSESTFDARNIYGIYSLYIKVYSKVKRTLYTLSEEVKEKILYKTDYNEVLFIELQREQAIFDYDNKVWVNNIDFELMSVNGDVTPADIPEDVVTIDDAILWIKGLVQSRTLWNNPNKQLNNNQSTTLNGLLRSGFGVNLVGANSDYITYPEASIGVSEDFTHIFRIQRSPGDSNSLFVAAGNTGAYLVYVQWGLSRLDVRLGGGVLYSVPLTLSGDSNSEKLIAIKRQGANLYGGVNGAFFTPETADTVDKRAAIKIGRINNLSGNYDSFTIGNTIIFNTALTGDQFLELYNNPQQRLPTGVNESNLLRYYKLSEGSYLNNSVVIDYSNNAQHGTFYTSAAGAYDAGIYGLSGGSQSALSGFNIYPIPSTVTTPNVFVTGIPNLPVLQSVGQYIEWGLVRGGTSSSTYAIAYSTSLSNHGFLIGSSLKRWYTTSGNTNFSITVDTDFSKWDKFRVERTTTTGLTATLTYKDGSTSVGTATAISDTEVLNSISNLVGVGPTKYIKYIDVNGTKIRGDYSGYTVNASQVEEYKYIFGSEYNSTGDTFGNAIQYPFKQGLLNFNGAKHKGVLIDNFPSFTTGSTLAYWHKPVTGGTQYLLERKDNTDFGSNISGSTIYIRPNNNSINTTPVINGWNFDGFQIADGGSVDYYSAVLTSTTPTFKSSKTIGSLTGFQTLAIGSKVDGTLPFNGYMSPPVVFNYQPFSTLKTEFERMQTVIQALE